jgi:hypothetical protein
MTNKIALKALCFVALLGIIIPAFSVNAQVVIRNPLQAQNFQQLIEAIINIIYTIGIYLAIIMILIAGFYYITAQGEPAKIQTAKQIIIYTIIGLLIIISAKGIVTVFREVFLNQPS